MLRIAIAFQLLFAMKSLLLTLAVVLASSSVFVGCTPSQAGGEEGQAQGISADTGYTRDRIYQWQDRTFRQLAY